MMHDPHWGLPDPDTAEGFYRNVAAKRFLAWIVDTILVTALVAVAIPFTAFIGLFFLPFLWIGVSFVYRTTTIARGGATLGMAFAGIELRSAAGTAPDATLAAFHTGAYLAMTAFFPAQLVSILMMLVTPRGQGLHDMLLGTAVLNRAA